MALSVLTLLGSRRCTLRTSSAVGKVAATRAQTWHRGLMPSVHSAMHSMRATYSATGACTADCSCMHLCLGVHVQPLPDGVLSGGMCHTAFLNSSACRIAGLLSNHQLLMSYHMLDLSLGGAVRPWPAHYEESMQQAPPQSGLLLPRAAPYFLLEDQACLPKQPYLGQSCSERKPGA